MLTFPILSVAPTTLEETIENSSINSEFESGFELVRSKFTRDRATFDISYEVLQKDDKDLVIDFVRTVRGAEAFTWANHDQPIPATNPVEYTTYIVRFSQFPTIPAVGGMYQIYNLTFQLREV